jgi:hypothetical protein
MGLTPSKESFQSVDCNNVDLQAYIRSALQAVTGAGTQITLRGIQAAAADKCLVVYDKRAPSGLVTKAQRVVTIKDGNNVTPGPELADVKNVSMEMVEAYYTRLRTYNDTWNRSGWRVAYTASQLGNAAAVLYDPPRPPWGDTLFERNVELYNRNLRAVGGPGGPFDAMTMNTLSASTFKDNFKRFIAPTPAEPVPLPSKNVVGRAPPVTLPRDVQEQLDRERTAADNNRTAAQTNVDLYNSLVPSGDPRYDPPTETDDYETVLVKFNVAYDIAAERRSGSVPITGSVPSAYNRRLRGRTIMPAVAAPAAIIRPIADGFADGAQAAAQSHGFVPFTERQKYLIDYSPFESKELLRERMCLSLGYLPFTTELAARVTATPGITMSAENGCFVEFPAVPAHIPGSASAPRAQTRGPRLEFVPPYTPSRQSPLAVMCTSGSCGPAPVTPAQPGVPPVPASQPPRKCPETTIRGKTVYVPSRPKNTETSRKIITYRMGTPVGDCPITGIMTADGFTTDTGLFN